MAWTVDQDTDDQRNRIAGLLMAMDVAEHAPAPEIFPHSPAPGDQLALSDKTFGPITSPSENTPNFTDFDFGDKGQPSDAGKSSGIFDPGAMTTAMASMTTGSFPSSNDYTDMVAAGRTQADVDQAMNAVNAPTFGQPGDVPGLPGAFGGDKGIPAEAGKGYPGEGAPSMPAPSTPSDWSDFAAMTPDAASAFASGFEAGAASFGGGQGEGAGQGDTTGGSSSSDSSSSSGDTTGGSSGVG